MNSVQALLSGHDKRRLSLNILQCAVPVSKRRILPAWVYNRRIFLKTETLHPKQHKIWPLGKWAGLGDGETPLLLYSSVEIFHKSVQLLYWFFLTEQSSVWWQVPFQTTDISGTWYQENSTLCLLEVFILPLQINKSTSVCFTFYCLKILLYTSP